MKTLDPCRPSFRMFVCASCLATICVPASAQPQASTYYPAPQPTFRDKVVATGRKVGDFVRRKFYGEPDPAARVQAPAYHRPPGSPQPVSHVRRYNLDAPAAAAPTAASGSTGFVPPDRRSTPKYVTPPRSEPPPAPVKAAPEPKSKPVTKPGPAPTASKKRAADPEPVASKKRSVATKSSTVAKSKPKSSATRSRTEDEPPASHRTSVVAPTQSEPPRYEAPPEPKIEARLNADAPPLSGAISPMVGGTDFSLAPDNAEPTTKSPGQSPSGTTADAGGSKSGGDKSSGSFLVGKKTSKAGRVISPYAPYNELDITGLPSGSLALDPTTQQVFQVP